MADYLPDVIRNDAEREIERFRAGETSEDAIRALAELAERGVREVLGRRYDASVIERKHLADGKALRNFLIADLRFDPAALPGFWDVEELRRLAGPRGTGIEVDAAAAFEQYAAAVPIYLFGLAQAVIGNSPVRRE